MPKPPSELDSTKNLAPPAMSPDGAIVTVVSGAARGAIARLPGNVGGELVVGKSRAAHLVLPDETVSRRHLAIVRTPAGLLVRDLDSRNGVWAGGLRVREALVEPGAVFRAGDVELLVGVELENVVIPPSPDEVFGLVAGAGLEMRRIFGVLERIAPTDASILVWGETGTGKDALARSIHTKSRRADGPFEIVDCGAVAPNLIESELFGHERGAFTGAVAARAGAFERAAGGTLFLDEIGELALDLQPKLLRVLEAREFRRVGGTRMQPADVRIIAATTRNLARETKLGTFREDLYFRLAVVTIEVPPLRLRGGDIPRVAAQLLAVMGSPLPLDRRAATALQGYDWPGNVRELRNVLERAVHLSVATGARTLQLTDFPPPRPSLDEDDVPHFTFDDAMSYREQRAHVEARFEREFVQWLLSRHGGNVAAAARAAKMDRNHLTELARRHDVERRRRGG